jgi:hypothetical protein
MSTALATIFDVPIKREAVWGLAWPEEERLETDSGLGGNRQYVDLRDCDWKDYAEAAACEADLISRLEGLEDDDARAELIEAWESYNDSDVDIFALMGLDIGVASVVLALSASGCAPCTSCNGGAFGDGHHESHPLVLFFSRQSLAPLLLECAEETDVGLVGAEGGLLVYSRTIGGMQAFGAALHRRRDEIRAVNLRAEPRRETDDDIDHDQLDLFDN